MSVALVGCDKSTESQKPAPTPTTAATSSSAPRSRTREPEGVTHEFFGMGAYVGDAKDAESYASGRLKDAFKK